MKIILAGCLAYAVVWCVIFIAAHSHKQRAMLRAAGGAIVALVTALVYLHVRGDPLPHQIGMSLCAGLMGGVVAVTHPLELLAMVLESVG